ncbi:MAG: MoxR family ATPase [Marinifilaceae bacterium]|nr:MoxR family ATPase [Marinifilaceae bacterium]
MENKIEQAKELKRDCDNLMNEIKKLIIGQDEVIKKLIISIISNGHCLLIGVPGLAKTLLVNTISQALDLSYQRIQFTPDLMPSDIIGSEILNSNREFSYLKGPIFANIILADEINRTPPKTQSALLEAMQERSITVGGNEYKLPKPFFVLATQNPIEQEGTYPLPEAQLDRFMFSINLEYPKIKDEIEIVRSTTSLKNVKINPIISAESIIRYQKLILSAPVNDNVLNYAVNLAAKTRPNTEMAGDFTNNYINWGAGPRASQFLIMAAKAHALIEGKYSPDIEDVKAVAGSILQHRIIKNYKAEAENISTEDIINRLMNDKC